MHEASWLSDLVSVECHGLCRDVCLATASCDADSRNDLDVGEIVTFRLSEAESTRACIELVPVRRLLDLDVRAGRVHYWAW